MGNQHNPDNLTPLEFFVSQIMPGHGLRTLHDAVVLLERLYHVTSAHDCGSSECIIPSFRTHVYPFIEWMIEHDYQTLPAAAVYQDLGLTPNLESDDDGLIDPSTSADIFADIEAHLKKNQEEKDV